LSESDQNQVPNPAEPGGVRVPKLEQINILTGLGTPDDSTSEPGISVKETTEERRWRWVFQTAVVILIVLGLLILSLSVLYGLIFLQAISVPTPTLPIKPEEAKLVIENHRSLVEGRILIAQGFFDNTVVKVFVPIFTTVMGVVLGVRIGQDQSKS
jgi:hypothetical protein